MPTVPLYEAPSVTPNNLPDVRSASSIGPVTAGRSEQQLGAAMQGLGRNLASITADKQININEAKVKEQDIALQNALRDIQHNPDSGYLNQLGKSAIDVHQAAVDAVKKLPKTFGQSFNNDAQWRMWKQISAARTQAALTAIDNHASEQTKVYNIGQTAARISAQQPDMVLNWNTADPVQVKAYNTAKATMLSEIDNMAELKGLSAEEAKALRTTELTKAHNAVIDQILSLNRSQDAREYFQKNIKEIDPTEQANIRKKLEIAGVRDSSLKLSLKLAGEGDYSEQTKKLNELYSDGKISAEVHDATVQRLERQETVRKAQVEKTVMTNLGAAQDFLMRYPKASVMDLPTPLYNSLKDSGHLPALDAFSRRDSVSKPEVWFNVVNHLGDGGDMDITKMPDSEWFKFYDVLSNKDFEKFSAVRVKKQGDPAIVNMPIFRDVIKNSLSSIGINPNLTASSSIEDRDHIGGIYQFAEEWVRRDQQAAGRAFNQQEITDSINRLFAKNIEFRVNYLSRVGDALHWILKGIDNDPVSNSLAYDIVAPFSMSSDKRMMEMTVDDIPQAARKGIVEGLARAGNKNPTDRDIMIQYWRHIARNDISSKSNEKRTDRELNFGRAIMFQ